MGKIFHTLRFQLPAVVISVFLGFLTLIMLFFHEMTTILIKTKQLAQSAEINDFVGNWMNALSSGARERTKLMSLGKESYLEALQTSLNEINELYQGIRNTRLDTSTRSSRTLRMMHSKHLEYMELLEGFAKEQMAKREAARLALPALATPVALASVAPARAKPAPAAKKSPVRKSGKGKGKQAVAVKRAPSGKSKSHSPRPASPVEPPAASAPYALLAPLEIVRDVELDYATNETFKAYEIDLREGLTNVQELMRMERKEQLKSLRNSVGRAKDRLIFSLLLLLAMVAYVAVVLKWKILDPMKILEHGAMEIGKGSLGYQVKVNSRNEIGQLAEVFNHMSVQLDKKQNAEFRLKRLEAIEQIVRSVNHEINNPLMIISGNAEYLLAILNGQDETFRSKLGTIVDEVQRIFIVTQRLKEIKEPITQSYIGDRDQMIDIIRSSQIRPRDY